MEKSIQAPTVAESTPDYKNNNLPIDARVDDLISKMTLKEKVAQMLCVWDQKKNIAYDENGDLDLSEIEVNLEDGIGQIGRISDTWGGLTPSAMVELTNKIQSHFTGKTRLGIPVIFHEECLHGLAAKDATSYPQPIGLASTFNPNLIQEIYKSIAEETRLRGAHQALTPVVDVVRDPRWGRVEETFGEDPYLVSQMGIAAVMGFQGVRDYQSKRNLLATLKHFAAHGHPESGSNCGPANYSERVMRDVFLYPFKQVINKSRPASVMASYNEIDGIPSHANKWLLRKILRDEWKYDGFVVSDYYAITEMNEKAETVSHAVAKDKADAARLAVEAGVNIELPEIDCYPNLESLVTNNIVEESLLDELIKPMLKAKFEMGLFEDPYIDTEESYFTAKLESDRKLALNAAHETVTLLKNENKILPLKKDELTSIAVIGPNADRVMLGGYSGKPKYYKTVLEGIKEKVAEKTEVLYGEGCKITINGSWEEDLVTPSNPDEDDQLIKEAVSIAEKSELVVLVLGGNEQTSREAYNKDHMGDRPSLDLVGKQNELVKEILDLGKPVIVVLFNGRPNSINYINNNVNAILECWYLGQESGNAVADILFGEVNPSGKLPISFPRSAGHVPCHYNHKPSSRRGYLFDDITPLFHFGYGLSYTEFEFSNLRLADDSISSDGSTKVFIDVKNTGNFAGKEVVQMYVRDLFSSVTRPVKELKGFKKIELKPGEKSTVSFDVSFEHLAFTDVNMKWTVEPGEFKIMIGNSSRDQDLHTVSLNVK